MIESGVPGTGVGVGSARRRRLGLGVAAGLAVLAVLHTATWYVVTGRMLAAVPEAVVAAAADGWRVEAGAARRGGWPLRAAVVLDGVVVTRELGGTRLRWTADGLDAGIGAWAPNMVVVSPLGEQAVTVGAGAPVPVLGTMTVRVPLRDGAVVAAARDVAVRGVGWGLGVATAEAQWDGQALAVTAGGIVPSPKMAAPFDGAADMVLHAVLMQPFPQAATPGESARAWRQAGGRLEVRSLGLHLAALAAEGSGEGGLDGRLQPEGRAALRVTGAAEVLDAAAAAGLVAPGPASAARAVLQLLTLAARGGPVAVQVELREGVLTVARFPIVRVPVLDWGG